MNAPPFCDFIPLRSINTRIELNARIQVMLFCYELRVTQNLWLSGVLFRPLPLFMKFGVPCVLIIGGSDIATCSGVPIPILGATHIIASFQQAMAETRFA